jgi:Aerotolerance regulator N-terminal
VIAWGTPAAFVGLIALAGPVLIHLLQRQRARRMPFPSDRFVRPAATGAVRLRLPSDILLLAVRVAVLAIAVCALAQPVIVTRGRLQTWDGRVARAIVVDTSESMATAPATPAVEQEMRNAATAIRIDSSNLAEGVRSAVAHLCLAPPARREIVVISDFQYGAVTEEAFGAVPSSIGVRFVRVGQLAARREIRGASFLGDGDARRPEIAIEPDRTSVVFARTGSQSDGLRIATANDAHRGALIRAVASSGAPGPAPEQPIVVTFDGDKMKVGAFDRRWMLETALRLRQDAELSRLSARGLMVATGTSGGALVLNVGGPPESYAAAAALRGVLSARQGDVAREFSESEVRTTGDAELTAWTRPAAPVGAAAWRYAQETDARWFWCTVVVLLALEMVVRARVKP